jgi:hypothetical protein
MLCTIWGGEFAGKLLSIKISPFGLALQPTPQEFEQIGLYKLDARQLNNLLCYRILAWLKFAPV